MKPFFRKTVQKIQPLGRKLAEAREELGLSQRDLAEATGIQPRFIVALEDSQYSALPGSVYCKQFLRQISAALHLNEEQVRAMYEREQRVVTPQAAPPPPQALPTTHSVHLPRIAARALIALGVVLVMAYLTYTVRSVVEPPALSVAAPSEDFVTQELSLQVEGTADEESIVHINGQEVFLDAAGRFSERVDLQPGLNVIKIAANKERSKENIIYRRVIVELEEEGGTS